nr:hypothetical protein [Clostridia bacterium]
SSNKLYNSARENCGSIDELSVNCMKELVGVGQGKASGGTEGATRGRDALIGCFHGEWEWGNELLQALFKPDALYTICNLIIHFCSA